MKIWFGGFILKFCNLRENLDQIIKSGPVQKITLHQVNENFFELTKEGIWLVDGGIELTFPEGTISAAFHSSKQYLIIENKPIKNIYTDNNISVLENDNIFILNQYLGKKIKNSSLKRIDFDAVVDYTMQTSKENHIVEMILEFVDNSILQIALVSYDLEEHKTPENYSYDITSDVLISTKEILSIK